MIKDYMGYNNNSLCTKTTAYEFREAIETMINSGLKSRILDFINVRIVRQNLRWEAKVLQSIAMLVRKNGTLLCMENYKQMMG